jgi:hypothetical protein
MNQSRMLLLRKLRGIFSGEVEGEVLRQILEEFVRIDVGFSWLGKMMLCWEFFHRFERIRDRLAQIFCWLVERAIGRRGGACCAHFWCG